MGQNISPQWDESVVTELDIKNSSVWQDFTLTCLVDVLTPAGLWVSGGSTKTCPWLQGTLTWTHGVCQTRVVIILGSHGWFDANITTDRDDHEVPGLWLPGLSLWGSCRLSMVGIRFVRSCMCSLSEIFKTLLLERFNICCFIWETKSVLTDLGSDRGSDEDGEDQTEVNGGWRLLSPCENRLQGSSETLWNTFPLNVTSLETEKLLSQLRLKEKSDLILQLK